MNLTKKLKIALMSLLILSTIGSTALALEGANPTPVQPPSNITQPRPHGHIKPKERPNHYMYSAIAILKNKYGVTDQDLEKAKTEGKTIFDIAKAKGLSEDKLKANIITPRLNLIKEMLATGELTTDNADMLNKRIKSDINSWDGKLTGAKLPKMPSCKDCE
jgi:hypothetical protein